MKTKTTIKKLQKLSLLLFACLSYLGSYGQTATAPAGAGTSGNPYQIATLENLYWISQNSGEWGSGKHYIQTEDIDVTAPITSGVGYTLQTTGNVQLEEPLSTLGSITIVSTGGAAEGTTWTYSNNTILPNSSTNVSLNVSEVVNYLGSDDLKIKAKNITVASSVVSTSNKNLTLQSAEAIVFNSASGITTEGGSVILWADYDGGDSGDVFFSTTVSILTGGGHLWIGGGSGSTTWNGLTVGDGYAVGDVGRAVTSFTHHNGITIQGTDIQTSGGHIKMLGKGKTGVFTGSSFSGGMFLLNSGSMNSGGGDIDIETLSNTGSGQKYGLYNFGAYTFAPGEGNLTIFGDASASSAGTTNVTGNGVFLWTSVSPISSSGNIVISGKKSSASGTFGVDIRTQITTTGGSITLDGDVLNILANISASDSLNLKATTDITVSGSRSLIGGTILIDENLSASNGTLTLEGASTVAAGKYIEVAALQINSGSSLTMQALASLKVNGNITNNGQITFKSDATGDAYFDTFTGSITGSGSVVSEKYYPAKRAFRMVASPVTGGSIFNNWQNEGVYEEGKGTHITGEEGTVGEYNNTTGIDYTISGNPSMFFFDNGWQAVTNTNNTDLEVGTPYRLMVRGDRNPDLLIDNDATPNPTTLISTGTLEVGTKNFTFPSATTTGDNPTTFAFIANPYQSRIDVSNVLTANGNADNLKFWVWDPMINTRGGFVTIDDLTGNGTTTPSSDATKFIEPGQAFFIQVTESNPTIQFTESMKDVTTTSGKPATFSDNQMSMLFELQNENNQIIDAIRLRFAADGDNGIDNLDAGKMGNLDENLASVNENSLFTIQRRSFPENDEVIPLFTNNWRNENYSFKANLNNFEDTNVYVVDNYLGTETLLENGEVYNFSIDAGISDSTNPLRFELKFDTISLGVEELANNLFSLYPNPAKDVVNIQMSLALGSQVSIEIYNMLGQQVYTAKQTLKASSLPVNVQDFSSGVYILSLTDDAGNKQSTQLIKE